MHPRSSRSNSRFVALAASALAVLLMSSSDSSGSPLTLPVALPLDRLFANRVAIAAPALMLLTPAATQRPARSPLPPTAEELSRYLARLPYGGEIGVAARQHGLDPLLLVAVVEAESSFRPDAVSERGAVGLMQLMPVHFGGNPAPVDPAANLGSGAGYLATLLARFGDLTPALAAYQAGPGAVARYRGVPPYRSTRAYVRRVLAHRDRHAQALAGERGSVATASAAF